MLPQHLFKRTFDCIGVVAWKRLIRRKVALSFCLIGFNRTGSSYDVDAHVSVDVNAIVSEVMRARRERQYARRSEH